MTSPKPSDDEQKFEDLFVRSFRRALKEEREATAAEESARTKTGETQGKPADVPPAGKPDSLVSRIFGSLFAD